jgi:hypothetical protein
MCEESGRAKTVNVSSVKRDEVAVKKKMEKLHTVLLFMPTPYSYHRPGGM